MKLERGTKYSGLSFVARTTLPIWRVVTLCDDNASCLTNDTFDGFEALWGYDVSFALGGE